MSTMKAVVCHGPKDYRLERLPIPDVGAGELLLKVDAVGICASDIKCFEGAAKFWGDEHRPAWAEGGAIPGHEVAGVIVNIDVSAAEKRGLKVGDRVVVEQIVPCGKCYYCQCGIYWMCEPHNTIGFKRKYPGGMAEYMLVRPESRVYKISSEIPGAHAAFVEPLACALHAVERANVTFSDVAVVAGCGPIGLGMIAGLHAKGVAQIIAVDFDKQKLKLAEKCGASLTINLKDVDGIAEVRKLTSGRGADVYFEATGHPSGVSQGLDMLARRGRFIEYSVFKEETSVDWTIISDDKELDVLGAHLGPHCWPKAISMVESGLLPLDEICTHQLKLEDFQKGLDLVANPAGSIKVSLIPWKE